MGWMVSRHGALYAAEHGYNQQFEGVVAQVVADFLRRHDEAKSKVRYESLTGYSVQRRKIRHPLVPPKPNEFDTANSTSPGRACWGT